MATGIGNTSYDTRTEAIPTASLNSIANDANAIATTDIDLTSALRYAKIRIDILLAQVDLSSQDNPAIYVWLLELLSGTTYEPGGASLTPARGPDILIPVPDTNAIHTGVGECIVRPGKYLALLGNRTGVALASSGNTIHYSKFSLEINN